VSPYMMTVGSVLLSVLVALAPANLGPVLTRLPSSAPHDKSAGRSVSNNESGNDLLRINVTGLSPQQYILLQQMQPHTAIDMSLSIITIDITSISSLERMLLLQILPSESIITETDNEDEDADESEAETETESVSSGNEEENADESEAGTETETEAKCSPSADDWDCCSEAAPCGLGEGDCDTDEECAGPLVCGDNNCEGGDYRMDCCQEKVCLPGLNDWTCCTESSPCGLGNGDCDSDIDCQGILVCGDNNCADGDYRMDCCQKKPCNPEDNDWHCCTKDAPCAAGGGDCDHDEECEGDLVCGNANCEAGEISMDCCVDA